MANIKSDEIKFLEELLHDITEISIHMREQDAGYDYEAQAAIHHYTSDLVRNSTDLRKILARLNADVEHNRQKTREYVAKRRESDPYYGRSQDEVERIKKREAKNRRTED